jgi:hypothetical protein
MPEYYSARKGRRHKTGRAAGLGGHKHNEKTGREAAAPPGTGISATIALLIGRGKEFYIPAESGK